MHGEHRIPAEKVLALRRVRARAADPARARACREGCELRPADRQHRRGAHDPRGRRGHARALPMDGRSLFELMEDPTREWGREILLQSGFGANGVGGYAALRNYGFLYVALEAQRRVRALRPAPRPVAAAEPRRPGGLRRTSSGSSRRRLRALSAAAAGRSCNRPPRAAGCARPARCAAGTVRVGGRELDKVGHVDFFRGRRRLGARPPRAVRARAAAARSRIRARAVLRYGRVVTLDRRLRGEHPVRAGPSTRSR